MQKPLNNYSDTLYNREKAGLPIVSILPELPIKSERISKQWRLSIFKVISCVDAGSCGIMLIIIDFFRVSEGITGDWPIVDLSDSFSGDIWKWNFGIVLWEEYNI